MTLNLPEPVQMPRAQSPADYLPGDTAPRAQRLLLWALGDWCVIVAAWTVMALVDRPPVTLAGIVVVASRLHALGAILHDACHRRRQDRSRWWLAVEMLAGWPIASTIEAMRYHHLRHHALSGTPQDPYFSALAAGNAWRRCALTARGALLPLWWTLRAVTGPLALLVPAARTPYARAFLQDRSGSDLRRNPAVIACARADVLQLAAQLSGLGAAFAAGLPVVSCYLLPWMLAGVLNARRVVYEHAWVERADRSRQGAWDMTLDHDIGILGNAIFYPHNIGLHRIHHRYPGVSFVHLPELRRRTRPRCCPDNRQASPHPNASPR